jgi:hypothetical protein
VNLCSNQHSSPTTDENGTHYNNARPFPGPSIEEKKGRSSFSHPERRSSVFTYEPTSQITNTCMHTHIRKWEEYEEITAHYSSPTFQTNKHGKGNTHAKNRRFIQEAGEKQWQNKR